jgi:two-component system, sensor histidine kinase ChiS
LVDEAMNPAAVPLGPSAAAPDGPPAAGVDPPGTSDAAILQYVVDNIPYQIFWKDRDSVYLGCNKSFAALDGKADPRELIGRTDFDMAWREHAHLYRDGDVATMTSGEPILDKEELSIDPSGNEAVILTSKVPLRDATGQVTGLLGILVDITARKRLELQLERAKREADRAAQAKTDFVANVTHELRTPLTLILGPLGRVLSDPGLGESSRRLLESARRNGFRLFNLVNDVLDFSKAESSQLVAHREPVELVGELRALIEDMRLQAELRQLDLQLESELPRLDALLDPRLVERMVVNLVGNAIKFTRAGGWVRLHLAAAEGQVRITVSDNGIGIPGAALDTLFEKFTQVDDSSTRHHEGTGLGLALVRHFAQALGGRVDVRSTEGRGSEFTLHLPLERPSSAPLASPERPSEERLERHGYRRLAAPPPEPRAPGPQILPGAGGRPWVLVAEDNPELRWFTMETLASEFSVVGVGNGNEAWQELSKRRFDVVVSDLMMPELDGLGLTAKIKAHAALRVLPVILVTARGGLGNVTLGLDAGADDYLSKPFAAEELLARVRAAHRMRSLQEQLKERARAAGAALATSGLLHNVGNTLNGVRVSAELLERQESPLSALEKLGEIWAQHCSSAAAAQQFLTQDERGQRFGAALSGVITQLRHEREWMRQEAIAIGEGVAHAAAMISRELAPGPEGRLCEVTDVALLLRRALKLSSSGGAANDTLVRVHSDLDELPMLYADPHALLQVFVNLLNNARQSILAHGRPGEIRVAGRVDGASIVVVVRDTGAGIHAENLPRLFRQGFSTRKDGHGLGLHTSWLTIRALGGTLVGESPGPGGGATFTVKLPVERADGVNAA